VGQYKKFVADAQDKGRYGLFGRHVKTGDGVLIGRGHSRELRAMRRFDFSDLHVNANMSPDDLADAHIEEIAPESGWLEAAVAKHKLDLIFLQDDTPITFQSQWDSYAYVHFINQELARFRKAVTTGKIDEASLTQANRLLLTGGWWELPTAAQIQRVMAGPEGDFEFGTRDGRPLSMQGRPFAHIGLALEQARADGGVPWERSVEELSGVLWHRTRDHYGKNSNRPDPRGALIRNPHGARQGYLELSGGASWDLNIETFFAAAFRNLVSFPGLRGLDIGLRVARPRP
jgi:hypothetical protein